MAIGIDLGTSNSCVAIARGGDVEVLANRFGEPISASVVCFEPDGSVLVGNNAKTRAVHQPASTITASKRLIGRYYFSEEVKKAKAVCNYQIVEGSNHSVRIKANDLVLAVPEVSALVLREMKKIAEERLGEPVTQAVITVPAYFNDNQRQATRDAGRIAGLEVLRLLNEPTAAALAYGFGRGLTQRVAIYDLGGGTFDISVLEIGEDVFEVLATCGDTFLGGEDFDDRLIDLLADEFHAAHRINLRNDPHALETLKAAAEDAKKGLSADDSVEIHIPEIATDAEGNPLNVQRTVSQADLGSLIGDLIQRTFKVCDEALQQASLTVRDLDGVILVGGPTRLPLIRDAVSHYFQQEPKTDVDPDQVVAMGAAIHAASLVGEEKDSYLLDVTPLSLRIGVAGGLAETVIERNTPVPIEQGRSFTTFQDYQQSVRIRVYQGESRLSEENELLGEFEFTGIKKARRGEVRIDVSFEIDTDGIVNVKAHDPDTGEAASTRIHLSSGLSEEEIEAIIARGEGSNAAIASDAQGPNASAGAAGARSERSERSSDQDASAPANPASAPATPAVPYPSDDLVPLDEGPELETDDDLELETLEEDAPESAGIIGETEFDTELENTGGEEVLVAVAEVDDGATTAGRIVDVSVDPEAVEAPPGDPIEDLDEADIDSLAELAADEIEAETEVEEGEGSLFAEHGTDLSQFHDDDDPQS